MGTPWGCPTTGATPSERKHRVSSWGRRRQSWWETVARLSGLGAPAGKGDMIWQGGLPPPCTSSSGPQEAQIHPMLPTAASRARL